MYLAVTVAQMTRYVSGLLSSDLDVFTIIAGNLKESVSAAFCRTCSDRSQSGAQDAKAIQDSVENILHVTSLSNFANGAFVLPQGLCLLAPMK